jgi:hypothetical protein
MKTTVTLVIACAFAVFALAAEDAKKAATPPAAAAAKDTVAPITMLVTAAKITAPLVIKDGALSQPSMTDVGSGGKAVFTFTIAKAGDYEIHGLASAPDDDNNSFFVNIDAQPEEPLMIWDMEHTNGFEDRVAGWRGSGDAASPEFPNKVFKLTAGEHKLNLVGREPAQLKSISIHPAKK